MDRSDAAGFDHPPEPRPLGGETDVPAGRHGETGPDDRVRDGRVAGAGRGGDGKVGVPARARRLGQRRAGAPRRARPPSPRSPAGSPRVPGPRNDDGTPNFWFLGLDLTHNGYPCVPILPVDADIAAMEDEKKRAQALRSRGKAPGEYVGAPDLWRPMAGWQGGQLLQRGEVDCFRRWPGSPGVGIVLGRELPDGTVLAFVDADVRHPGAADDVRRLFETRLGAVPRRVGAAPKQGWPSGSAPPPAACRAGWPRPSSACRATPTATRRTGSRSWRAAASSSPSASTRARAGSTPGPTGP